jgi:type I restriction enzyme R subunit
MNLFAESTVEDAALKLFTGLGYTILHGPEIAAAKLPAERTEYSDVVLVGRLRQALARINPKIPAEALEGGIRKMLSVQGPARQDGGAGRSGCWN